MRSSEHQGQLVLDDPVLVGRIDDDIHIYSDHGSTEPLAPSQIVVLATGQWSAVLPIAAWGKWFPDSDIVLAAPNDVIGLE